MVIIITLSASPIQVNKICFFLPHRALPKPGILCLMARMWFLIIPVLLSLAGCASDNLLREAPEPEPEADPEADPETDNNPPPPPDTPSPSWPFVVSCDWSVNMGLPAGDGENPLEDGENPLYKNCPVSLTNAGDETAGEPITSCTDNIDSYTSELVPHGLSVFGDKWAQILTCDTPMTIFTEYRREFLPQEGPQLYQLDEPIRERLAESVRYWATPEYAVNTIPDFVEDGFPDGLEDPVGPLEGLACYESGNSATLQSCFPIRRIEAGFYQEYESNDEGVLDFTPPLYYSARLSVAAAADTSPEEAILNIEAATEDAINKDIFVLDEDYSTGDQDYSVIPPFAYIEDYVQGGTDMGDALCGTETEDENTVIRCVTYLEP